MRRSYLRPISEALSTLDPENLQQLIKSARNLSMNKFSHKLCLVRRTDKEDVASDYFVTDYIQSKLAIARRAKTSVNCIVVVLPSLLPAAFPGPQRS